MLLVALNAIAPPLPGLPELAKEKDSMLPVVMVLALS
jgi:hypothetical protein